MKILFVVVVATLATSVQPGRAEENWLDKLNPFDAPAAKKKSGPSALQKLGEGTKKLGDGTKKLVVDTCNLLTFQKPAKKKTTSQSQWGLPTAPRKPAPKKESWIDSLFKPKEPEPVTTLKDWVGLPRLDP